MTFEEIFEYLKNHTSEEAEIQLERVVHHVQVDLNCQIRKREKKIKWNN